MEDVAGDAYVGGAKQGNETRSKEQELVRSCACVPGGFRQDVCRTQKKLLGICGDTMVAVLALRHRYTRFDRIRSISPFAFGNSRPLGSLARLGVQGHMHLVPHVAESKSPLSSVQQTARWNVAPVAVGR